MLQFLTKFNLVKYFTCHHAVGIECVVSVLKASVIHIALLLSAERRPTVWRSYGALLLYA